MRRVVRQHLQIVATGEVPQGLGEVPDRIDLPLGQIRKTRTRIGDLETETDALTGDVPTRRIPVLEPIHQMTEHIQIRAFKVHIDRWS